MTTWIVEGPWRDIPGTDERECDRDRVELSGYEISTAFEAYRLACLPGNPAFGECRFEKREGSR